mgnify:CR=1 FL=1
MYVSDKWEEYGGELFVVYREEVEGDINRVVGRGCERCGRNSVLKEFLKKDIFGGIVLAKSDSFV